LDVGLEGREQEVTWTCIAEGVVHRVVGDCLLDLSIGQIEDRIVGSTEGGEASIPGAGTFVVDSASEYSNFGYLASLEKPGNAVRQGDPIYHR